MKSHETPRSTRARIKRGTRLMSLMAAGLVVASAAHAQSAQSETDMNEEVDPEAISAVVSCAVCHGPKGQGDELLGAPRIGGMSDWYLERQLTYFRDSIRGARKVDVHGTQMRAMALALDQASEVAAMAHYFSTLSPPPAPATVTGDAEHGSQLYKVCAACHGQDGAGNQALNAPALKGQHDWYLVRQLENYEQGLRGSNPLDEFGGQMVPIVKSLEGRQDYLDLAAYINTL